MGQTLPRGAYWSGHNQHDGSGTSEHFPTGVVTSLITKQLHPVKFLEIFFFCLDTIFRSFVFFLDGFVS